MLFNGVSGVGAAEVACRVAPVPLFRSIDVPVDGGQLPFPMCTACLADERSGVCVVVDIDLDHDYICTYALCASWPTVTLHCNCSRVVAPLTSTLHAHLHSRISVLPVVLRCTRCPTVVPHYQLCSWTVCQQVYTLSHRSTTLPAASRTAGHHCTPRYTGVHHCPTVPP